MAIQPSSRVFLVFSQVAVLSFSNFISRFRLEFLLIHVVLVCVVVNVIVLFCFSLPRHDISG